MRMTDNEVLADFRTEAGAIEEASHATVALFVGAPVMTMTPHVVRLRMPSDPQLRTLIACAGSIGRHLFLGWRNAPLSAEDLSFVDFDVDKRWVWETDSQILLGNEDLVHYLAREVRALDGFGLQTLLRMAENPRLPLHRFRGVYPAKWFVNLKRSAAPARPPQNLMGDSRARRVIVSRGNSYVT